MYHGVVGVISIWCQILYPSTAHLMENVASVKTYCATCMLFRVFQLDWMQINMFCTHYCDAGYRARPGGQTCIANPTWTMCFLPSWTAMLSLCPWRTKAAFIDSYCYPYVSSWEGKDVYRLSRCSSGTQPSTCLSCYWEVRKLKQQRVVNPEAILKFHCDKEKGNHLILHII